MACLMKLCEGLPFVSRFPATADASGNPMLGVKLEYEALLARIIEIATLDTMEHAARR